MWSLTGLDELEDQLPRWLKNTTGKLLLTHCHVDLSISLLPCPWDMAAGFPQNKWSEREQDGSICVFYDLLFGVTHHHLCHSELLSIAYTLGGEIKLHFLNYKRFSHIRKLHKKGKLVMAENTNELTIKNSSPHSNIVYTSLALHPSSPCPQKVRNLLLVKGKTTIP